MEIMIKSKKDLDEIKERQKAEEQNYKFKVLVCAGAGCVSSNCYEVKQALENSLKVEWLDDKVKVVETGCMGTCNVGPTAIVLPDGVFYCKLKPHDMVRIVQEHLMKGNIVEELCYTDSVSGKVTPYVKDIEFFNAQTKIVLRNCGRIGHDDLSEYISNHGYYALEKALNSMSREAVIEEMKKSGLRGRGGGGFPTGFKWQMAYKKDSKEKYVICNADEGDPGAFMDRSVLEGDPHSIIEGMAIAGYAIGAGNGVVYVRAEYPIAVERLKKAISQAREAGLLGKNIFGTEFSFDIEIRIGAGAFVCGEETALIASVEGKRGEPKQKPPFPSDEGLYKKPSIINNVETFANVAPIIFNGADWFAKIGTENSHGTKVFALAGDVNNTGIIEVPMGTTLGEVIYDIGGGVPQGKNLKAAQTGGPSGGCLTKEHLNTPIDYNSLVELGAIMGSGGLICMDEDTCMVDVARFFMEFVQEESCGKCVACRLGTKRMLEILERITQGKGEEGDIEKLIELGQVIKDTALCGLGQTAPNPVLSTIKHFREEYEEHIKHKYCRAGVCSELFLSPCENACPANVNVPGYLALVAAGRIKDAYDLIRQENPLPAVCGRVCTHPCEFVCRRAQLDEPIAIRDLKRYVADEYYKMEQPRMELVFPRNGKKVAIIGAGPSGLTCAYYLGRLGYEVTIYEQQSVAGGMLAYGIPEYRLPKEVLDKEIGAIKQVGINIRLNTEVGKDITFKRLQEENDAVYIATGTQFSRKIGIQGENLKGVYHGIDFLRDVNLHKDVHVHGVVAVIGGGSTAFDAARTARRMGATEVHVLYRRTVDDMPAEKREIEEAAEEGIIIHELLAPIEIVGNDDCVNKVICNPMKLEGFGSDGRKKPVSVKSENFELEADLVIPAVSQYSDLPFIGKDEVEMTNWGTFVVDKETQMTTIPGVFAGGDVVRGADVVITAIADGKKAAENIDKYLGGSGHLNKGEQIDIPMGAEDSELAEHERFEMKMLPPEERCDNFDEVVLGFHRLNAIAEAMRCLRCDRR